MRTNFSPSINIIRDVEKDFYYVPTPNAKEVYQQIAKHFNTGVHSFNIIGSYGTGKSAFLLALRKHLQLEREYFAPVNGQFNECKKFEFLNVVGDYSSMIQAFAKLLSTETNPTAILTEIQEGLIYRRTTNTCLVITVDELGKYLEYAVQHNPDEELYFIQQLAEIANDVDSNLLFISTLHQNFDAYAVGLSQSQRQEWEKVKGRLKELAFNEPVEQLLQLVTHFLEGQPTTQKPYHPELTDRIQTSGTFNLLRTIDQDLAQGLYPFDVLSAAMMTKALQHYGQNERSLFHFLSAAERYGLQDYDKATNPYYNLSCVYDYLQYNYYGVLASRHNPAYFKWSLLRNSLDRVQLELADHIHEAQKLVKTIGILNILGTTASKIDDALLIAYGTIALGIEQVEPVLETLLRKKIIRYQKYNNRYKLFEGTDIDIDQLIEDKKKVAQPIVDIVAELRGKFNLGVVPAKAITYRIGTPRFFEYQISNRPITSYVAKDGAIDGIINLVFQEEQDLSIIQAVQGEPILYGLYEQTTQLRLLLQDIKAVEAALLDASVDRVAREELLERLDYHVASLNQRINKDLFAKDQKIAWHFNGAPITIKSQKVFNKQLSTLCETLFAKTPVFRNELMNKQKPSSVIHASRKLYFRHLLEEYSKPNLGFPEDKFPAEKTIYQTLLQHTGIHRVDKQGIYAYFDTPTDESFLPLWEASLAFLESAKASKRSVQELVDVLKAQPFGIKDGFIEFWIGTFLFIHREEFALFGEAYIPKFSVELVELLFKDAHKYKIKTFQLSGIRLDLFNKYRALIQAKDTDQITNTTFKQTAAPFLVFYKQLPTYTQKTERLDASTKRFRTVISKAKELEKTFFEDLPAAMGYTLQSLHDSGEALEAFAQQITDSIRELRLAFSELINRIEKGLLDILGLPEQSELADYTAAIKRRYRSLKKHLLLPKQKVFYNRLMSQIDDKENWLKNVTHAVLGKKLEQLTDLEEAKVVDQLQFAIQELDNLVALGKEQAEEGAEVLHINIQTEQEPAQRKNIIISPKQQQAATVLEESLKALLSDDKAVNQAALIQLLRKYL